jgi:hypothetical protein
MKETLKAWYEHRIKDQQRTDRINKVPAKTQANVPLFKLLSNKIELAEQLKEKAKARSISAGSEGALSME